VLVRREDGGALAIGQLSHAWLSGQLARAWGNEQILAPEPREPVALGAEQHDVGWALFDLRPGLSAETGLPRSFLELTVEEHLAIWATAPDRLLSTSACAALVVSMHGCSLSQLRLAAAPEGRGALQGHIEGERARQAQLLEMLELNEEQAALIQRQMWTWDALSLALCNGWEPFTCREVPGRDGLRELELRGLGDGTFAIEPWPFSVSRLQVRCEARRLDSSYEDEQTMQLALEQAERVPLEFTLVAGAR
jgi:hypothetical protein